MHVAPLQSISKARLAEGKSMDRADSKLMTAVAKAFYLEDRSKVEIAREFDITRFKVARLLEEARRVGIVRISIAEVDDQSQSVAASVARRLRLKHVTVVPTQTLPENWYNALAAGAATLLTQLAKPGMSIGISWGRTLVRVGLFIENLPQVDLVQLTGMLGYDPNQSPLKVMSNISSNAGGRSYALMSALFSSTSSAAARLREEPNIKQVLQKYDGLDIALISVGSWKERITQLTSYLSESEIEELDRLGAVADCAGIFIDAKGNYVQSSLNERRLSVSVDQLRATPAVLAVAGEPEKASAIIAIARAGIATHLVTTREAAYEILYLLDSEDVTEPSANSRMKHG
ncbi:MAG: sugar-binding domain-containing protein [Actinomyces sp.]|nr:sugar-binding domain-containing protein [Actinomyces sp.]MDU1521471.1 sugar-binding domain-containing protein [Actinomyces sp.]MDU2983318.1 sugar-binding domain-containing protein [Actinomyces sp.]